MASANQLPDWRHNYLLYGHRPDAVETISQLQDLHPRLARRVRCLSRTSCRNHELRLLPGAKTDSASRGFVSAGRCVRVLKRIQLARCGSPCRGSRNGPCGIGGSIGAGALRLLVVCGICGFICLVLRVDEASAAGSARVGGSVTADLPTRACRLLECRQDFALIHFQRLLLFPTHQVDIELRDAGVDQSTQLFAMSFDRSDNAETINDFIRPKIGIAAFDFAVMLVVVAGAVLHVRSERGRQVFWLVLTDEIHDVVRNQRWKPPHTLTRHS